MSLPFPAPLPPPPTSTLPLLQRLLSLLETTATTSSSSTDPHTRSFELAAATSSLRQQLVDAEKYAQALPGGTVKEEQVEEIVDVLERRGREGRRTLASLSKLAVSTSTSRPLHQPTEGDVSVAGDVAMSS